MGVAGQPPTRESRGWSLGSRPPLGVRRAAARDALQLVEAVDGHRAQAVELEVRRVQPGEEVEEEEGEVQRVEDLVLLAAQPLDRREEDDGERDPRGETTRVPAVPKGGGAQEVDGWEGGGGGARGAGEGEGGGGGGSVMGWYSAYFSYASIPSKSMYPS